MPFATTTTLPPLPPLTSDRSRRISAISGDDQPGLPQYHFDILRQPVVDLRYGNVVYPLKSRSIGRIAPEFTEKRIRYTVDGLPSIIGRGDNRATAIDNFREEFHRRFQELFAKRPFEMDKVDSIDWSELNQLVDTDKYRRSLPIRMRRFGMVQANASGRHRIQWEGSTGSESIDLKKFPAEFAGYKAGQPFEAIALVDSDNLQTIRVIDVVKKSAPPQRTTEDNQQFWEGLGGTADLPSTSWK